MRVLIAGAGGTIGRLLVPALIAEGHEVAGLTRSKEGAARVADAGARPLVADALESAQLARIVAEERPAAVVNLLTALPKQGPTRASQLKATNRLRTEGTENLLAAVKGAGVRRVVAESIVFAYGFTDFGQRILDETSPPAAEAPSKGMRAAQQAVLELERQTLEASSRGDLEGVVLRLGTLYGAGVPSSEFMLTMLKWRVMALPGGGHSVLPWIMLPDAVNAIMLALHSATAGEIYNIVDGEPVTVREFVAELARAFATPGPYSIPYSLGRLLMPFGAHILDRTVLRVANEKATRDLGWRPEHPTYRDGIRHWTRVASDPAAAHEPATPLGKETNENGVDARSLGGPDALRLVPPNTPGTAAADDSR